MPGFTEGALSDDGVPERPYRSVQPSASCFRASPTPAHIFVSLAILNLGSLGFGLAAQLLAG